MRKSLYWKVVLFFIFMNVQVYAANEITIGTLSEGSCWFEQNETIKVVSFNDKSVYEGSKDQIMSEIQKLMAPTHSKIIDAEINLHCGGYGASLVLRVSTDGNIFCLWSKFENGELSLRSLGILSKEEINKNSLCDGHKWGELIVGTTSIDFLSEMQNSKWSTMIKSTTLISKNMYKIILMKDYEFQEQVVIDSLRLNFSDKNQIRYIEFNKFQHPVGESISIEFKGL